MTYLTICCILVLNLFCTNTPQNRLHEKNNSITTGDSTYLPTGFYFLSGEADGVKIRMEHSDKVFTLAKKPFASVNNIRKTELKKIPLPEGIITELCLTFDSKGTEDIEINTGNPLHPKMAVIIANKLLYVVDNNVKIKTGVMCIILDGYSEQEMIAMKEAVDKKN